MCICVWIILTYKAGTSDLRTIVDLAISCSRKGPKKGKKIPPAPGFELWVSQ